MTASRYRSQSFWLDTLPGSLEPRPALASDESVDVAIVGAGLTGLWTAYYLKQHNPGLRVAIVEAEIAGFGASGRNGGWCLGTVAGIDGLFSADPEGARRLQRELFETVDEVGRVCRDEEIDCHFAKGGNITVATSEVFRRQLKDGIDFWRGLGAGEADLRWLDADECSEMVGMSGNLGGLFLTHVAALHPARLVRGLAEVVEGLGVTVYERSAASELRDRTVVTEGGSLRADVIVLATEGYTRTIRKHESELIPVHSMMIATEPLPSELWDEIGLVERPTFSDARRNATYGQRTVDGRLAFGCRGAYFYGSKIHNDFSAEDPVFGEVQEILEGFFPAIRGRRITHRWGGALGIPRTWTPSVGLNRETGLGWAGGYVGEGVGPTNLAGRTLADLILEQDTDRTSLPLVGKPFSGWEPEPLRFLGYRALRRITAGLDNANIAGRETPRLRSAIYKHFIRK